MGIPLEKKEPLLVNKESVLGKMKGVYLSESNRSKLAKAKEIHHVSESRIVDTALTEFFEKYE